MRGERGEILYTRTGTETAAGRETVEADWEANKQEKMTARVISEAMRIKQKGDCPKEMGSGGER